MPRTLREVVFVDGVRTPFGKAGEKGMYAQTRADDLVIRCIRELLRRNPGLPPERVEEVAIAATTQIGDQGLTLGRMASLLAGLPKTTPGYSVDRMCAGAMTAVTTTASLDRLRCDRHRHRRRRRAHGPPPDGRGRRPQPAHRRREARRPLRPRHGQDGREPARPLPAADQGARGRLRRRLAGQAGQGLRQRPDPARPRPRRDAPPGARLRPRHRRRAAAPGHHASRTSPRSRPRSARTATSPPATAPASTTAPPRASSPAPRPPTSSACPSGCAWSTTPSSASSPRSWASARSRPPRRPWRRPA